MQFYICIWIITWILDKIITPFLFGEDKKEDEYNAKEWLISLIMSVPIVYFLINYLLNT